MNTFTPPPDASLRRDIGSTKFGRYLYVWPNYHRTSFARLGNCDKPRFSHPHEFDHRTLQNVGRRLFLSSSPHAVLYFATGTQAASGVAPSGYQGARAGR